MFLTFLQESNAEFQIPSILSDSYDFGRGFLNGTSIMKAVPSLAACDPYSEKMNASVHLFVETLSHINAENYQEVLINATVIGRDIYDEFALTLPKCLATINETSTFSKKLISHLTQDGYAAKIIGHATQNLIEVFQRVARIQGHVSSAKHFEAGQESGLFFNFLFFHDFVLAPQPALLALFKRDAIPSQFKDFAKGFLNGTNVFAAIPSFNSCDPMTNKTKEIAQLFIETANNITFENYKTQLPKLYQIGMDLYTEIHTNIPKCSDATHEAMTLYKKLAEHVHQDGYSTKVMSHAMTNILEVFSRVSKIQDHLTNARHFNAGQETGSFHNFLFFHDL